MNILLSGHESGKRFNLLLSLTRINSVQQIKALRIHLVNGMSKKQAADLYSVDLANFNRALTSLNQVAAIVEKLHELQLNSCQLSD